MVVSAVSRLELKIQALSLVAALLTIPAIFLQSSNSHTLHYWGDLISIAIWLFFVVEAMILLRITPNNWDWLRKHKLEALIVVGASPIFTLMGEREMVFGVVPLLIIPRVLKLLKFAKIIKIGKLLKSVKIVKRSQDVPGWIVSFVQIIVAFFIIGILGTIINKKSKSIVQGFTYWIDLTINQFHIESNTFFVTLGAMAIATVVIALSKRRKQSAFSGDWTDPLRD